MKGLTFDVFYYEDYAIVAAILFKVGDDEAIIKEYNYKKLGIADYEPGMFYKRELPCILEIMDVIDEEFDFLLVDSYVYITREHKGLGAYLYEHFEGEYPVIGVAKNFYRDVEDYGRIFRGTSQKPLFVTSAGIELEEANKIIEEMQGEYRIPTILKRVDELSRIKGEL